VVILWDSLDEKEKKEVMADLGKRKDWVIWKKAPRTLAEWQEESFLKEMGECILMSSEQCKLVRARSLVAGCRQ
jgi:hypothetical protein